MSSVPFVSPSAGASLLPRKLQPPTTPSDFAALRHRIRERGLLHRQPSFYVWTTLWLTAALGLSLVVLAAFDSIFIQALNGVYTAFLHTQIGFLMHDAGHMQIFRRRAANDVAGLLSANLLIGLSYGWWVDKHNRHHGQPNHLDHDPDIDFPVVAFCEEQAREKKRPWRWIVRFQAFLFVPLLFLESLSLVHGTFSHLLTRKVQYRFWEWTLLTIHYTLLYGFVFWCLEPVPALVYVAMTHGLIGVYTGAVFAPNHKGMPVYGRGSRPGFLERQVLTSRNVRGNPLNDFLYGGLNYQIEHHLFPSLQRSRLGEAQGIVRDFCAEQGLRYEETGVWRSYREILRHLHRVSAPLRRSAAPGHEMKGDS